MEIPVFNTFIHPLASQLVNNVLGSTFLSEGKLVKEFETRLSEKFGLPYPVALNSGTSALHLALELAGIRENDEVILPAQTFVATGLTILQVKAVPVFADVDYQTGNLSIESLKSKITSRTKAIMPVHWGGYPCDMDEIIAIAAAHRLIIIEDAAHALGATYKNRPIGSLSEYTCFSFQAIKHLTTGDGGAISFKNSQDSTMAMTRRWFGIDRQNAALSILGERQYDIKQVGFKYHMNDYAAALGIANMEGFSERLAERRRIAQFYFDNLGNIPGLRLFNYKNDREGSFWLFGLHVEKREDFIRAMKEKGIATSVIHQRIDRNSVFGGLKDLPEQAKFDETQIHIPIHDAVDKEKAEYVVNSIKQGW